MRSTSFEHGSRASTLARAVVLLAACDEPEPPPVALTTAHFEIAPDFAGQICAGNLEHMESRLAWLEQALGLQVEQKIRFNWYAAGDNPICSGGGPCSRGSAIYGDWSSFDHELVHAVLDPLGRAHPFLEEGMAVTFSVGLGLEPSPPSMWLDDNAYAADGGSRGDFYAAAAHFTRYLHDTYGVDRLLELYRRSDYDDGPKGYAADIEAVYGRPFAEIEAEYLERSANKYPPLGGCPEPTLVWDGAVYSEDVVLACDEPAVLRLGDSTIGRLVTLELSEPTFGEFTVDGVQAVNVQHCDPMQRDLPAQVFSRLEAGFHSVMVTTAADSPRTVQVAFTPRGW